jgi:hypothetical protein
MTIVVFNSSKPEVYQEKNEDLFWMNLYLFKLYLYNQTTHSLVEAPHQYIFHFLTIHMGILVIYSRLKFINRRVIKQ